MTCAYNRALFFGVRPTWDGLLIDPCLPPHWIAHVVRPWRGKRYEIEVEQGMQPRLITE